MNSWKKIKLGDALDYVQPTQYIVTSADYKESNEIPVLTPGKSFILGYTDEKHGVFTDVPTIIFDDFTTAFKYVDFPFKVKSSAMKMLLPSSEEYNIKFLYYLMLTLNFTADEHKRFWISQYSQQEIFIPPLEQQKKIAAILDAADAYRQKTKALIAKYDELTQSLFLDMFGDPVKNEKGWEKLSGRVVFKLIGGAAFKSSDYTSQGIPLIRIGTVNKGYFDNAQLTFLPSSFEKSHSKYLVYPDDLLITLTGTVGKGDYGNAFSLTYEFEKYLLNQRVAKICNSEKHHLVFLKFFLKQNKVKNELIGVSRGVRQANLSNEDFYKLETITPPLNLQTQFAERVAIIEKQKVIAQASLEKAEELFNSLLKRAFKGELL
ncbi:MAG: type restriction-modification system subunit [Bacteroidota bacterium]|jgi:type I restriction enzyme S subunit